MQFSGGIYSMQRALYSELRTIYETSVSRPNTFRQTIKLRDLVDGKILRQAVIHTNHQIVLGSEQTAGHLL